MPLVQILLRHLVHQLELPVLLPVRVQAGDFLLWELPHPGLGLGVREALKVKSKGKAKVYDLASRIWEREVSLTGGDHEYPSSTILLASTSSSD